MKPKTGTDPNYAPYAAVRVVREREEREGGVGWLVAKEGGPLPSLFCLGREVRSVLDGYSSHKTTKCTNLFQKKRTNRLEGGIWGGGRWAQGFAVVRRKGRHLVPFNASRAGGFGLATKQMG
eukprot:TRINITY_DN3373_c1_g1_i1.p3 TRINITY_DN3373_c1_g1~~TRINITY_DN3373_c1_g1_i1.p3  ORF type:complete len:122 (+),score=4.73 TRINITY_DN3373_c1_g1_i1:93-458(+)